MLKLVLCLVLLCSIQAFIIRPGSLARKQLHHFPLSHAHASHSPSSIHKASPLHSSVEDDSLLIDSKEKRSSFGKLGNALRIVYKFSRPHTIKGTILASVMGVVRALIENPTKINLNLIPKAIVGLIALLCGNAYIVGINQIYDVKIDEINKPFLPIAAKLLSEDKAWALVITGLLTGISVVKTQFSTPIYYLYMLGVVLGTVYSVPPIQLKRFPIFAGSIIAVVRGFLLNFGVYYAVREALGVPFRWNPVVMFISSFMTVFASVIAVTKDLPDVEGDKKYQIDTFAAKYGAKPIARVATAVLSVAYLIAMALPLLSPGTYRPIPMVLGHATSLAYFLSSYAKLEPDSMPSVKKYYKAIWNLFYFEYLL